MPIFQDHHVLAQEFTFFAISIPSLIGPARNIAAA